MSTIEQLAAAFTTASAAALESDPADTQSRITDWENARDNLIRALYSERFNRLPEKYTPTIENPDVETILDASDLHAAAAVAAHDETMKKAHYTAATVLGNYPTFHADYISGESIPDALFECSNIQI